MLAILTLMLASVAAVIWQSLKQVVVLLPELTTGVETGLVSSIVSMYSSPAVACVASGS